MYVHSEVMDVVERLGTPGGSFTQCQLCPAFAELRPFVEKVPVQLCANQLFHALIAQLLSNAFGPQNCFRSSSLW